MSEGEVGTIYLLHFDRPYRHAQHYLGWTSNLEQRLAAHRNGKAGARLMEVIAEKGIGFQVARTWTGTRSDERRKKVSGHSVRSCPICRAETEPVTNQLGCTGMMVEP